MKNYKLLENKIRSLLAALTSGILTNLIYNIIYGTSYIIQSTETQTTIIPQTGGVIQAIGIILLTFITIWAFITILIPLALKTVNRFHFKKIVKYGTQELVSEFEKDKKEVLNLATLFFSGDTDKITSDLINLRIKELAVIITDLHKIFCPSNARLKARIKYSFRNTNHSSIINITDKVSSYEFLSLIAIMREMVCKTGCSTSDSLLKKDLKEMNNMLSDLEKACHIPQT